MSFYFIIQIDYCVRLWYNRYNEVENMKALLKFILVIIGILSCGFLYLVFTVPYIEDWDEFLEDDDSYG